MKEVEICILYEIYHNYREKKSMKYNDLHNLLLYTETKLIYVKFVYLIDIDL